MMSEKLREQISALADNELPADEHELLVRRFSLDKHQRICWERYHLIGEAMRKALPQIDAHNFTDRIMQALDDAPQLKKHNSGSNRNLRKSATGITLAACVAIVAVYGVRHGVGVGMKSATAPSEIVPTTTAASASLASFSAPNNSAWNGNTPDIQAQLANYVINHNEIATTIEQQGMLPYFYLTTVQSKKPAQISSVPQKLSQQDKR
jgi:sigma-E factor negative regulatory protein RseA